jgi:hypothetical protein
MRADADWSQRLAGGVFRAKPSPLQSDNSLHGTGQRRQLGAPINALAKIISDVATERPTLATVRSTSAPNTNPNRINSIRRGGEVLRESAREKSPGHRRSGGQPIRARRTKSCSLGAWRGASGPASVRVPASTTGPVSATEDCRSWERTREASDPTCGGGLSVHGIIQHHLREYSASVAGVRDCAISNLLICHGRCQASRSPTNLTPQPNADTNRPCPAKSAEYRCVYRQSHDRQGTRGLPALSGNTLFKSCQLRTRLICLREGEPPSAMPDAMNLGPCHGRPSVRSERW